MAIEQLHRILATLWVVWFTVLFVVMLLRTLRPGSAATAREHALIPFRNDPN